METARMKSDKDTDKDGEKRGVRIIIIIKKGQQCKAETESDIHPISLKTPAPQYQPID